jgi:hypothetical protein
MTPAPLVHGRIPNSGHVHFGPFPLALALARPRFGLKSTPAGGRFPLGVSVVNVHATCRNTSWSQRRRAVSRCATSCRCCYRTHAYTTTALNFEPPEMLLQLQACPPSAGGRTALAAASRCNARLFVATSGDRWRRRSCSCCWRSTRAGAGSGRCWCPCLARTRPFRLRPPFLRSIPGSAALLFFLRRPGLVRVRTQRSGGFSHSYRPAQTAPHLPRSGSGLTPVQV